MEYSEFLQRNCVVDLLNLRKDKKIHERFSVFSPQSDGVKHEKFGSRTYGCVRSNQDLM